MATTDTPAPDGQRIPGAPSPETPPLEEPGDPRPPAPAKADQAAPELRTAAGLGLEGGDRSQRGRWLTTATGVPLRDTDHSLKAGPRGPTLLQDHHLREKVMHFDHERIPERVVHARGAAAHGYFEGYGTAGSISCAGVFDEGRRTPVSYASPPSWAPGGPRTRCATLGGSRPSSTPQRASGT